MSRDKKILKYCSVEKLQVLCMHDYRCQQAETQVTVVRNLANSRL